jgi:outer membrane biosynthesis protein TonB
MKLKNIKRVIAVTGIITIATVGFIVSGTGEQDVSEAEVDVTAVNEVVTTKAESVEHVQMQAVGPKSKIYTFNATTQQKQESTTAEVTTEKSIVTTEKKTEMVTEKKSELATEKQTESMKPATEKVTEVKSEKREQPAKDVKKDSSEKKSKEKQDIEETEEQLTSEEQETVKELEAEEKTEEEEQSGKTAFGYTLQYSAVYNVTDGHLTRSNGSIRYNGHRETWYSTNEAAGKNTAVLIPGKHVADDGTIRDADGYVCVASSDLSFYSTVMTSVGPGKVYDCGCSHGTIDVYTNW